MTSTSERSLYDRLGGYDTLAAFTDDFLQRLTSDPEIGIYWRGHSTDSMKRDRQLLIDFLCEAIGGPFIYRGRDMRTSHQVLRISERDWQITIDHIAGTLDHLGVTDSEREEFLDCVSSVNDDTV